MPRYENVQFEFLSAAPAVDEANGAVVVRSGEMVLEVEYPGGLPYLIRGRLVGDFFSGRHQSEPEDVDVAAKWTKLDDVFIGTWVEDGIDFVFTFRLPPGAEAEALAGASGTAAPRPRTRRSRSKARRRRSAD